ncbi:MAG: hypothetical protein AAF668_05565 [Pseudomonadota bacterium]
MTALEEATDGEDSDPRSVGIRMTEPMNWQATWYAIAAVIALSLAITNHWRGGVLLQSDLVVADRIETPSRIENTPIDASDRQNGTGAIVDAGEAAKLRPILSIY